MFTPIAHIATALSVFTSVQLTLPPVSRIWASEPTQSCAAASNDRWTGKAAARKVKSTGGGSGSPTIQIVRFGP